MTSLTKQLVKENKELKERNNGLHKLISELNEENKRLKHDNTQFKETFDYCAKSKNIIIEIMIENKLKTLKDYIMLYNVFEVACVYVTGSTDTVSRKIIEANPYYIPYEKEKHYKILYIDSIYKPEIKEVIVTEQELKEQCDKVFKLMKAINSNRMEVNDDNDI